MAFMSSTLLSVNPHSLLSSTRPKEENWFSNGCLQNGWRKARIRVTKHGAVCASLEGESRLSATTDALIIGAGVSGLATALAFKKVGIKSIVLERADYVREEGTALSLWPNAWKALDALGVGDELRHKYTLLESIRISSAKGALLKTFRFDECKGSPHEVRGLLRRDLLQTMARHVAADTVRYGAEITRYRTSGPLSNDPEAQLQDGSFVRGKVLVGADGMRSSVASHMGLAKPEYAGYSAFRGVTKYPEGHKLGSAIQIVLGQGVRAGMYPLTDTDVYWFTCFNAPQGSFVGLSAEECKKRALDMVSGWACGVEELIRNTPADNISRSEIRDRLMVPQGDGGRWGTDNPLVTLAGDAAHPMTPNLGQGACTALEDAVVLARHLATAVTATSHTNKNKATVPAAAAVGGANKEGVKDEMYASASGESALWGSDSEIMSALGRYERERTDRCAPIVLRSRAMGVAVQIPFAPVCFVRDNIALPYVFPVASFLNHALYDCGNLP